MKLLFLLLTTTLLFARVNPFVPLVNNENNHSIKPTFFTNTNISLPNDARVLKSITFTYQALTGSIKSINIPINKAIDWHNPIFIYTKKKKINPHKIKISFLNLNVTNHKLEIYTKDKLIRHFILVNPFRFVIDFKANKNFLTYTKTTKTFIQKIVLGNHKGFYRIVLYLDGTYKTYIENNKKGYSIEFK